MMPENFQDPIFRGCTRPAMLAGVPMLPMILVSGVMLILSFWSFYLVSGYVTLFILMVYIPIIMAMRHVTKKDDQRLKQLLQRAIMRLRHKQSRRHWGAISFSPIRYKKRK